MQWTAGAFGEPSITHSVHILLVLVIITLNLCQATPLISLGKENAPLLPGRAWFAAI